MTDVLDFLGIEGVPPAADSYRALGYSRNPFRPSAEAEAAGMTPFYTGHILEELKRVLGWIKDVHRLGVRQPMALVGNIGAGKSRILSWLRNHLSSLPADERVWTDVVLLSETGYGRASVGGFLVAALERMSSPDRPPLLDILPLVWSVVTVPEFVARPRGPLGAALRQAWGSQGSERSERARLISRWLQRSPLTPSEANRIGLHRRIDWEGELIRTAAEFLRLACDLGVLKTLFLFVDQLEDLFGSSFSDLRRARILSDLRSLVDEIDAGAPIGLMLAWTPDFTEGGLAGRRRSVEVEFREKYEALFGRMQRRRVDLPLLTLQYAEPFASEWVQSVGAEAGWDRERQPPVADVALAAWSALERSRALLPGDPRRATPRQLLTALGDEVDRRAGLAGRQ
jgi:hypothetical protein